MTTPRPTRVQIESDEVKIRVQTLEPDIRASVGDAMTVTSLVENQADVQIQVVEII